MWLQGLINDRSNEREIKNWMREGSIGGRERGRKGEREGESERDWWADRETDHIRVDQLMSIVTKASIIRHNLKTEANQTTYKKSSKQLPPHSGEYMQYSTVQPLCCSQAEGQFNSIMGTAPMAFCGKRVIYLRAAIEPPTHRIASHTTNSNHSHHSQATTKPQATQRHHHQGSPCRMMAG